MSYWIAKISYNLTWAAWYLLFKLFAHYTVVYEEQKIKKTRGPFIIAANHSSWLDPFLISGIFPIFSPVFPIRFATYHVFFRYFYTALFVRMYGCFQIRRKVGLEKVLAPAVKFLNGGQAVGIFPEAKKRHLGRPRKGRRGAAYLAIKTGSPILPCRIEGAMGLSIKKFFSRKRKITVYVGRSFRIPKELDDSHTITHLNLATEIIMQKIAALSPKTAK